MSSSEMTDTSPRMESNRLDLQRIPSMDFDGEDGFNLDDNGLCLRSWGEQPAGSKPSTSWKMMNVSLDGRKRSPIADMIKFLCSPHRIGRYRQRSSESEVEYLLWLLNRRR